MTYTDRVEVRIPIGSEPDDRKRRLRDRMKALVYRFGGEDPECEITDDDELRILFTISAESAENAQEVFTSVMKPATEIWQLPSWDYVDEWEWPEGIGEDLQSRFHTELEAGFRRHRLNATVSALPTERGGLLVELHDPGGHSHDEAMAAARDLVRRVWNEAVLRTAG